MPIRNIFVSLANQVYGKLGLVNGGTNADLSATGGTSKVLQQATTGAAITVGQLAASDLSDYSTGTWVPIATNLTTTGTVTLTGTFTKVGKVVFFTVKILIALLSTATCTVNSTHITLPFSTAADSGGYATDNNQVLTFTGNTFIHNDLVFPPGFSAPADTFVLVAGFYNTP